MEKEFKKAQKLFNKSQDILVLAPATANEDILSAVYTFYFLAKSSQKRVAILNNKLTAGRQRLNFLPQPAEEDWIDRLFGSRDFLISFDLQKNKIVNIATETVADKFVIRLTPEKSGIDPRDFSLMPGNFKYDLLVLVGLTEPEELGEIYQQNVDLFFEVPKINLDNSVENANFGQANLVDITAIARVEILSQWLKKYYPKFFVDQKIAQILLTGLIAATNGFREVGTNPHSLHLAAELMENGADQKEIIRYLYKTKPLPFLKLWGAVMTRLRWEESKRYLWASLAAETLRQFDFTAKMLPEVLQELKKHYSRGKIFTIFYNEDNETAEGKTTRETKAVALIEVERLIDLVIKEFPAVRREDNIFYFTFPSLNIDQAENKFRDFLTKSL